MNNLRKYGFAPFNIAVIHGGPGAPGEMKPVALELSNHWGVLEPLQTADTLKGQVKELKEVLDENGDPPIFLIGWSWGAWLSFIFTANHSSFVKKLILIGSGPFLPEYAGNIMLTRLSRLDDKERVEALRLLRLLSDPEIENQNQVMAELGQLILRSDIYDPISYRSDVIEYQYNIYNEIWEEASELRSSGKLLELAKKIKCEVVAIHGDYDPHPYEGVEEPLSNVLNDIRFILLEKCGHYPWYEKAVKDRFYEILRNEIVG